MKSRCQTSMMLTFAILISTTLVAAQDECSPPQCTEMAHNVASPLTYFAFDVQPLLLEMQLLHDGVYNRVSQAIEVFDAPDGRVIGLLDDALSLRRQDGWKDINPNQWFSHST